MALVIIGILVSSEVPALTGWDYGRNISVNNQNTGIDLVDCQIKVTLDASNFSFANAEADGSDIRIYDDLTDLPIYIESYDDVTEEAVIWFKGDVDLHSTKAFYLYYGNAAASAVSDYNDVFHKKEDDINTLGLWNFNEGSGTSVDDETGSNNLTLTAPTWGTDFKFSNQQCVTFNGTSSQATAASILNTYPDSGYIEIDFKPSTGYPIGSNIVLCQKINLTGAEGMQIVIAATSGKVQFISYASDGTHVIEGASASWSTSVDYAIAVSWDVLFVYIYINGALYHKEAKPTFPSSGSDEPFIIGSAAVTNYFHGKISSVKVSEIRLTDDRALAHYERRKLIPAKQIDKFLPYKGDDIALQGTVGEWDELAVGEATIANYGGGIVMVHTGYEGTTEAIGLATASSPEGPFTKAGIPTFGVGYIGNEPVSRGYVYKVSSTYYVYMTNQVDYSLYCRSTTNFSSWTDHGKVMDKSVLSGSPILGNPSVILIGSTYILYMEALTGGGSTFWEIHRLTSSSPTGPFTYDQLIPTLQVESAKSVGGGNIEYFGGKYHWWAHYSGDFVVSGFGSAGLPGRIYYANSTDGITWSNKEPVIDIIASPFTNTDQYSDPSTAFEFGGKTYIFPIAGQNFPTIFAEIRRWTFEGTRVQLVGGGQTISISAEQSI